ncbi:MAG: stage V sporulation protein AD, partial [Clostridia bacterium]|nr:stage V sporulation protein AD [Clostridia bacterium]
KGTLRDILYIATGALMNPASLQQGRSIPGIAHLVRIASARGE